MIRLVLAALTAHVALGVLVEDHGPLGVDRAAFDVLDPLRTRDGLDVVRVVTDLGSWPAIAAVIAAAAFLIRPREAILLAGGALALALLVHFDKQLWDRPRPATRFYDPSGHSFPSGHSAQAVAWVAAAMATGRRALIVTATVVAVTIGASRLYLHVHYLTDVLGGFLLGAVIFAPVLARTAK